MDDVVDLLDQFDRDIFYFYGHAEGRSFATDNDRLFPQSLKFRGRHISMDEIDEDLPTYTTDRCVLVVLNGCDTGASAIFDGDSLVGRLCLRSRGMAQCVGTVHRVPMIFAAHFGLSFMRLLLCEAQSVEQAILKTRRALLDLHGWPFGIFYSFWGNPGLAINPENN